MFAFQDIAQDLSEADSSIALFEKLNAYADQFGFEYFCYGIKAPTSAVSDNIKIFDTYPNGWMAHYQSQGYIDADPTVQSALKSTEPILWPDWSATRESRFWSDARDHGLAYGIAQPVWSARGVFGLLSFARGTNVISPTEEKDLSLKILWLANAAHSMMSNHILADMGLEGAVNLSERELEVLRWTSDGMNAAEVSEKLNISISTVNWHIQQILTKLGARNKVQAVFRAISLGIL